MLDNVLLKHVICNRCQPMGVMPVEIKIDLADMDILDVATISDILG